MPQKEIQTVVTPLCQKLADKMNYELVDAELVKEGPGRYLRIYIDRPGGISLDELEKFHREIQPQLDRVDYDFLEVCSPGLDRPLTRQINPKAHSRLPGMATGRVLPAPTAGQQSWKTIPFFGKFSAGTAILRRQVW